MKSEQGENEAGLLGQSGLSPSETRVCVPFMNESQERFVCKLSNVNDISYLAYVSRATPRTLCGVSYVSCTSSFMLFKTQPMIFP